MTKMISWNVNGLRAVVGKGFMDAFKTLDADIFCLQDSTTWICRAIISTGITPKRRAIPERLSLHAGNCFPFVWGSARTLLTTKGA